MGSEVAGEEELRRLSGVSLDHAPERRRAREAVKHIHSNLDHCLFKVHSSNSLFVFFFLLEFV